MIPENIKIACENAKGAGECSYSAGCVIQQLALLHNMDFANVKCERQTISSGNWPPEFEKDRQKLFGLYGKENLKKLQETWDGIDDSGVYVSEKPTNNCLLELARNLDWPKPLVEIT